MCPNLAYQRSIKRERQIVNEADANGAFLVARTAGSKSKGTGFKTDVFSVSQPKDATIYLTQVKTKKGGRHRTTKDIKVLGQYTVITRLETWD